MPKIGAPVGVTDHGELDGLSDDDHSQYWNASRGDLKVATHAADLDAHTRDTQEEVMTGKYFFPHYSFTTTVILPAGYLIVVPFPVIRDITVDRIAAEVTTAASAGKHARLGIYQNGTNLHPGSLLLDAGEVLVDSTGAKAITIDQSLTKGLYWIALVAESGTTFRSLRTNYGNHTMLGFHTAFSVLNTSQYVIRAYGSLPDPFPAGASTNEYYGIILPLRVASLD